MSSKKYNSKTQRPSSVVGTVTENTTTDNPIMMMSDVRTYVINLKRRRVRLESFLKRIPLDTSKVIKFEAVDGKYLPQIRACIPTYFQGRLPGEVGCFLSHKRLWEKILQDEDCDYSMVFEDDVKFSTVFVEKFHHVLNDLNGKISEFDTILYIGGRFIEDFKMRNSTKVTDNIVKFDYGASWSSWDCDRTTHAYIISKRFCQLLLNEFHKRLQIPGFQFPPVDHYIMQILRLNKKEILHTYPLLCYSDLDSESDIGLPLR